MVAKAGDFVDIESVDLSGSLRGMVDNRDGVPLEAKVKVKFMGKG